MSPDLPASSFAPVSLHNNKIYDLTHMIDASAKGTIEKIEKNMATINYGIFTAKTNLDQLELVEAAKN